VPVGISNEQPVRKNDRRLSHVTPEIRTRPPTAIAICIGALVSLGIASLAGSQLEKLLDSQTAATVVLVLWCVLGCAAAIAAVVDAYVKPEGERLGLATTIAATVFAILGLAVVAGVVAGAADLGKAAEIEALESAAGGKKSSD
jgi:drug/metabolite transporter (DMT)-like permease